METNIIDDYIIELIEISGTKHTIYRYEKMNDTLKSVISEINDLQKVSVLTDVSNFMDLLIERIKKHTSTNM